MTTHEATISNLGSPAFTAIGRSLGAVVDGLRTQLARAPRAFPRMRLNPEVKDLFAFRYEDFTLEGYDPHPAIKAPIAV